MTHADVNDYDAGLLNDWGGGNVDWWQDYIRAEVGRANDHWRAALEAAEAKLAEADRLAEALRAHHAWHLAQDREGAAWGIDPVDAYSESGLCEMTTEALAAHEARKGEV